MPAPTSKTQHQEHPSIKQARPKIPLTTTEAFGYPWIIDTPFILTITITPPLKSTRQQCCQVQTDITIAMHLSPTLYKYNINSGYNINLKKQGFIKYHQSTLMAPPVYRKVKSEEVELISATLARSTRGGFCPQIPLTYTESS